MNSFPFTSDSGDRKFYTKDFRALFKSYFTNGVFNGGFAVTPDTGMKVNISAGWCNIEGAFGYSEDTVEKSIETVSTETYFNIVLRLDDNKANRNIDIYVVKGTSSPAQLTRNDTVYELCIARIKVGASDTSITLDMIEDTRLKTDLCGVVACAVQTLDTSTYYEQLQGTLDRYISIVESALDETLAGNLQSQIDDLLASLETTSGKIDEAVKYVNFKYSTTEQWTGEYWTDGKKIYTKTFYVDTNSKQELDIDHNISNIGDFRAFDLNNSFWYRETSKEYYPLNVYLNSTSWSSAYQISNTQVKMRYGSNFAYTWKLCITIRYTKV